MAEQFSLDCIQEHLSQYQVVERISPRDDG